MSLKVPALPTLPGLERIAEQDREAEASEYITQRKLGCGAFGDCYLVQSTLTQMVFAMKEITQADISDEEQANLKKEVRIMRKLQHRCIIRYEGSFVNAKGNLCILMDYAAGGDLALCIKAQEQEQEPFKESVVLPWFVQMTSALAFLHERSFLHRDLKPSNVFLSNEGVVKLGDFGISKILDETTRQASTCVGTPIYMAPELFKGEAYDGKADIWSLGVVIYETLSLANPFKVTNTGGVCAVLYAVMNTEPAPLKGYSSELIALTSAMLSKEPVQRPYTQEVLDIPLMREVAASIALTVSQRSTKTSSSSVNPSQNPLHDEGNERSSSSTEDTGSSWITDHAAGATSVKDPVVPPSVGSNRANTFTTAGKTRAPDAVVKEEVCCVVA